MLLIQQQKQDHSGTIHDSTPEQPQQNQEEIAGTQHNNRSKKVVGKYTGTLELEVTQHFTKTGQNHPNHNITFYE